MFTISLLFSNNDLAIFAIVCKEDLIPGGNAFKKLPITTYGFLKVSGNSYENSFVSYLHIADEVSPEENKQLTELAKSKRFNLVNNLPY